MQMKNATEPVYVYKEQAIIILYHFSYFFVM